MQHHQNNAAGAWLGRWAKRLIALMAFTLLASCTGVIDGDPNARPPGPGSNPQGTLICQQGLTPCNSLCVDLQSASDNCGQCGTICTAPAVCASGNCNTACAAGYEKCGDACVSLMSDAGHCGSCGKTCDPGVPCQGGVCGCPEGVLLCQGQCSDASSDPAHCGTCETACAAGKACVDGDCQCAIGEQLCGETCSNLNTPAHCGGCGKPCAAGEICAVDHCISGSQPCPAGLTRCGDACVNLMTAPGTCGSCENKCPADQACSNGQCGCPAGKTLCGKSCVDLNTSPLHCGTCTTSCTAGQACQAGQCKCADTNAIVCDGACVNPKADKDHCGNCTTQCMGGLPCTNGACACPDGETLCAGACTNTDSTAEHCGGCGVPCPDGESCLAGKCSGAIGDACSSTPAVGISITSIAVYQAGKIPIMEDGQAVGEDDRPADVIQGKAARVRVFVKLESGWANRTVSARLLLTNGDLTPSYFSKRNVTQASTEGSFATTFNFDVKAEDIVEGTRYAVEIVECDGTPAGMLGNPRFPTVDNQELQTRKTGVLKIRFIPLNANNRTAATDDARIKIYTDYLTAMYPTSGLEVSVAEPFNVQGTISAQGNGWGEALDQIAGLHEEDNAPNDLYYYGLFQPTDTIRQYCNGGCVAGIGYVADTQSFSRHLRVSLGLSYGDTASASTLAHEIGHNHGRPHSPCGGAADADQNYPYNGAKIGWWGFEQPDQLKDPNVATDIMGYCDDQWVSDYTYRLFANRIALLNGAMRVEPPSEPMQHFLFLLTDVTGPRWGVPRTAPRYPTGTPELANVLDDAGDVIAAITVYRTPTDHLGGAVLLVPDPEPGWHAVQIQGEVPLAFGARSSSQP